jgi:hypothetical protein
MFCHDLLKVYDYNTILSPIVQEFKKLEKGVEMNICGTQESIKGALTAVIADNLAAHQVGGGGGGVQVAFSKGFRKCRTCLGTDEDIQNLFFDCNFIYRSREDHDKYCEALRVQGMGSRGLISKVYSMG